MLLLFFSLCIIYMRINAKSVLHQTSSPGVNTLFPTQILYTHKLQLQLFFFFSALSAYNLYNKLKTKQQQQSARWHTQLDRWSQWHIIVTWFLLLSCWGLSGLNGTLPSSVQNTPSENHLSFELCKKSNILIPTQWQKKICRGFVPCHKVTRIGMNGKRSKGVVIMQGVFLPPQILKITPLIFVVKLGDHKYFPYIYMLKVTWSIMFIFYNDHSQLEFKWIRTSPF